MEPVEVVRKEKMRGYLDLAGEVRALAQQFADEAEQRIRSHPQKLDFRDRVVIGLILKMYDSFDCLVEDAKESRSGAMHHLKTLMETFIYLTWMLQDNREIRARLVFASMLDNRIKFYRRNPGYIEEAAVDEWVMELEETTRGIKGEWTKLKRRTLEDLANEALDDKRGWYTKTYKQACGSAHMGDLLDYMPDPENFVPLDRNPMSHLHADIALDYGLLLMWWLLKLVSNSLQLGFEHRIVEFESRHATLRNS